MPVLLLGPGDRRGLQAVTEAALLAQRQEAGQGGPQEVATYSSTGGSCLTVGAISTGITAGFPGAQGAVDHSNLSRGS